MYLYKISSFEKYKLELDSGNLKQGFLHTSEFWEDNFKAFEFQDFEYIRLLTQIIKSPSTSEADIKVKCIACFDIGEFAKLYPGAANILNHFGAKDTLLDLITNSNLELKNKALVCLQKIMMKSMK